ncbi:MAG: hypothetical protein SV375_08640, partial [Thermodesulfobacteriota bacterium]|nr:hypothetical protein [Thermodesulfobacteriota bacterium]
MQDRINNILIIGANGNVATLLARKFSECNASLTGIDLHPGPSIPDIYSRYFSLDILDAKDTPNRLLSIMNVDCVLICLPEQTAISALPVILREMASGMLLVDTLSVKSHYIGAFSKNVEIAGKDIQMVSINPMFNPALGFKDNNVAVINMHKGPLASAFVSLLKGWGANLAFLTAEEHDANMAAIQVATHASLLSFGLALSKMGYDIQGAKNLRTPMHAHL